MHHACHKPWHSVYSQCSISEARCAIQTCSIPFPFCPLPRSGRRKWTQVKVKHVILECELRILLCEELSFFGPPPFAGQLDSAYKDFLAYCKSHGIRHSQPPFVPKMVLLANRISSVCFECYHDIALLSIKQKRFGLEVWVHHNKLLGAGWCYRWIGCGMRWA